jgi:hypothetical protein
VRLPNGSHTSVCYGALESASDDDPTTSEVFTYAIRVQFVGDQDGQALVRLPDQSQTIVEYTALTVAMECPMHVQLDISVRMVEW